MAPAWRRALARSFAILLLGTARLAGAQEEPLPDVVGIAGSDLASGQLYFQCNGSPTCVGEFAVLKQDSGCSTPVGIAGTIQITVPDISVAGPVSGSGTLVANWDWQHLTDGTCIPADGPTTTSTISFSGTSDGYAAQVTYTVTGDGKVHQLAGTLVRPSLTPPSNSPPFQLTVDKNITPTTASATAQIQPPAADIGKTVSVYVFAFAPRSLVKSAAALARKDDAGGCELAQYDPQTGELRSASSSSLAAAFTGTLTAQGQAVTILNNASTPSVAGATFFVGYGSDAQTMIGQGINTNAVQVPGAQQCPTVFPKLPGALSGLWWAAGGLESGWGIDFTQRENHVFAAFYTYDGAGQPKWYVASDCRMPAANVASGTCTGDLYELTATPLFGIGAGGSQNPVTAAGSLSVSFTDASHATMSYTVGSVSRTVAIERQLFAGGTTAPTIDYTDLWWGGQASSGWGMAISHQYNTMFLAWFVYDAGGKPTWYVVSDCSVAANGNGCSGDVYKVTGPPFGPTFQGPVLPTAVGSASITFTDPNNGTFNYTVNGTSGSKVLTRQVF